MNTAITGGADPLSDEMQQVMQARDELEKFFHPEQIEAAYDFDAIMQDSMAYAEKKQELKAEFDAEGKIDSDFLKNNGEYAEFLRYIGMSAEEAAEKLTAYYNIQKMIAVSPAVEPLSKGEYQKAGIETVGGFDSQVDQLLLPHLTSSGLTLDEMRLSLGFDVVIDGQQRSKISNAVQEIAEQIASEGANSYELESVMDNIYGDIKDMDIEDMNKLLSIDPDTIESWEDWEDAINSFSSADMGSADMQQATESLNQAYTELQDSGYMSEETMNSLIAAFPYLQDQIYQTADGYYIEQQALDALQMARETGLYQVLNEAMVGAAAIVDAQNVENNAYQGTVQNILKLIQARKALLNKASDAMSYATGSMMPVSYSQQFYVDEATGERITRQQASQEYADLTSRENTIRTIYAQMQSYKAPSGGGSGGGGGGVRPSANRGSGGGKTAEQEERDRLKELKEAIEDLERPADIVDKKIKALGNVNTVKEKAEQANLLAEKFRLVSSNLEEVNRLLNDASLTSEMREHLEDKKYEYLADLAGIHDDIESNVRDTIELEKKNAELEAELAMKKELYELEQELYGDKGKELWEHENEERVKELEELVDAREKEKEAREQINEEEEYQNKLLEARLKLQNALNDKTIKILKKQADGTWQFEYAANPEHIKQAEQELRDLEKDYADWQYDEQTDAIKDQIDELEKTQDELADRYDDLEFHLDQKLEAQKNAIEKTYADIEAMTIERMEQYEKTYGGAWDKVIAMVQNKLDKLTDINTRLEAQSEYAYELTGLDSTYVYKVQGYSKGGYIKSTGLFLGHGSPNAPEAVLNAQQTLSFSRLVSLLPNMLHTFDVAGVAGLSSLPAAKRNDGAGTVIEHVACNFPSVTSPDGIQKAILELPRLALQQRRQ